MSRQGKQLMKTTMFILGILVVLGLIAGGATFVAIKFGGGGKPAGMTVRVVRAERGELTEIVSAPGTVVPETNVSISARVNAKIVELPYKIGERVTRGDPNANPPVPPSVLVKLDSTEIEAQLRAAEARHAGQLAEAETAEARITARSVLIKSQLVQLENRETELERQKALLASQDVSQQVVDDLMSTVSQLRAQIEGERSSIEADKVQLKVMRFQADAASAEIDRIRDSLNYTTIVSPIDGVVTQVKAEVGEIAVMGTMNNAGTVILEVADLSKMIVESRVDETDIAAVKVGQKAGVIMQAYPDEVFDGVVQTIALARTVSTTDRSEYYEIKVLLDRKERMIVSGLSADVEIHTQVHENELRVPSQAILNRSVDSLPVDIRNKPEVDQNKTMCTVVYRLVNGKTVVTPVKIGASDMTHTIVQSGLSEDDLVIVGPFKILDTIQHDTAATEETSATQPATKPS